MVQASRQRAPRWDEVARRVRDAAITATLACLLPLTSAAQAQDYPARTIRLIVGASPEATPRLIADELHKQLGQPVIVESRGGAGGDIAAKAVATSEPDGYTLLYASSNYSLATAMQLGTVDFAKDFAPIALVGTSAYVLVTHPSISASTVPELISLIKSKPGEFNCGSSGLATPGHLGCEMLRSMVGVNIVHVPFRNAGAMMNGLVAGQVQFSITVSTAARGQIEAGAIRGLAVTTDEPSPLVPGLPALHTFGFPGFVVKGWGSFVAPASTPRPIVEKLNAAVVRIVQKPEIREKLFNFGMQAAPPYSSEQFGEFIRGEIARWNNTIDVAGVKRGKQ